VVDVNGDSFPDLYVLNMQGANHLYLNAGGRKFVDSTAKYFPKTPWGAMGIKFFDYDNDGRPDLLITDMHSDMAEVVGPSSEKLKARIQMPEAMLGGPKDRFIVGNEFNSAPQVLVSDLAQKRQIHWLKVALVGTVSNRNGLGATVRVTAGGKVVTQWNDGKSGYLSQSVLPLYFGLGDLTKVDRV